ncbi:MAG: CHAT domain-containing protein [Roseivirga sp.]|nr:CHAT domain-containing protein [Roseivirga sp.]
MKVFLTSRAFLILSFLWLLSIPAYAFFQNATARVKTKYEFTDTRISEADTLLKKRQYQEALDAYQKAYDTYEAESFYEGMVYAKERMGRTYRSLGEDSLSKITYQAAASLSREKLGPNHILESKAYLNNGIRAHRRRSYIEASKIMDSAMWIYESASSHDSSVFRTITDFKFYTYYYSRLSGDTLVKYLNERGRIFERSGSRMRENITLMSDYSRAFYRIGDFQKAAAYALEGVRLNEANLANQQIATYTESLFNLARALDSQAEYDRALSVADKLISYTEANSPNARNLISFYNLKAVILNGLERYNEAAQEFLRIIEILESENDDSPFYRSTIMNLGVCYQLMEDFEKSETYLRNALERDKEIYDRFDTPLSIKYKYLGQLFDAKEKYGLSFNYYDSALRSRVEGYRGAALDFPTNTEFNGIYEVLDILKRKQIALEKLYSHTNSDSTELLISSIEHAEKTHEFLMTNREELQAAKGKLFLSENFKELYESGINSTYLLYEKGIDQPALFEKIFKLIGQSKSILFLEQSGELGQIRGGELSVEIREKYYKVKTQIETLEQEFERLNDEIATNDSIRIINSELMGLKSELKQLLEGVSKEVVHGHDSQITYSQEDLKDIRRNLAYRPERAVLEYFMGDDYIYMLYMAKDQELIRRIEFSDSLELTISRLTNVVGERPQITNYKKQLNQFEKDASFLYAQLIGSTFNNANNISQITVIPDDVLTRLPFEVLIFEEVKNAKNFYDLDFLIKRYSINYALSSKQIRSTKTKRVAKKELFGVGYSGNTGFNGEFIRSEFGALPGTEEEILFLQNNLRGDFFLGESGSKPIFIDKARDYDVLHLAVHGRSDSLDIYKSSLIFNGEQNNILKTSDLYVADLKARVAILSACESGVGKINKGEGTFSIARGFALVGVPSIVMSLWKVNDQSSARLMVDLHKKMKEGESVDLALTNAKRDFLNNSDQYTSHPYYWSAFVSLGEEVEMQEKGFPYIEVGILLITVILLLLIRQKKRRD